MRRSGKQEAPTFKSGRNVTTIISIVVLLLMAGCVGQTPEIPIPETVETTTTVVTTTTTTMSTIPPTVKRPPETLLDIPLYMQAAENLDGQAAVQMVLAYYGVNKTQKQISLEMGRFGRTYPYDLVMYLKKQGLNAYIVEDFKEYAGVHPQIVQYRYGESLHWAVLKGTEGKYITLYKWNDPLFGNVTWTPWPNNYTSIVVEGWS